MAEKIAEKYEEISFNEYDEAGIHEPPRFLPVFTTTSFPDKEDIRKKVAKLLIAKKELERKFENMVNFIMKFQE
jgi:hypothetical protein